MFGCTSCGKSKTSAQTSIPHLLGHAGVSQLEATFTKHWAIEEVTLNTALQSSAWASLVEIQLKLLHADLANLAR